MSGNKLLQITRWLVLPAVFITGLVWLFLIRFEAGDIYPPYSSLRSDPLGARAFFESLGQIDGLAVTQGFERLAKIKTGKDTTLFYIGIDPRRAWRLDEDLLEEFERIAGDGGRVVLAFSPVRTGPSSRKEEQDEQPENSEKTGPDEKNRTPHEKSPEKEPAAEDGKTDEKPEAPDVKISFQPALEEKWGIRMDYDTDLSGKKTALPALTKKGLPETLALRTNLFFQLSHADWDIVYARKDKAIIIRRNLKHGGSIVLCADTYLMSNEAMRNDRMPRLLAWLAGRNPQIVFDEFHLGIRKEGGVATLARKYRLHGFFWGLLVLAGLFVWKNTSCLVQFPAPSAKAGNGVLSQRDHMAGLVSLLRRNIPKGEILGQCLAEWRKSAGAERNIPPAGIRKIENIVSGPASANPVQAYREICRILRKRDFGKTGTDQEPSAGSVRRDV